MRAILNLQLQAVVSLSLLLSRFHRVIQRAHGFSPWFDVLVSQPITPFGSFERCTALFYIATDICHQFSLASLLVHVPKATTRKINSKDDNYKYATFIIETAATSKLKRNQNLLVL